MVKRPSTHIWKFRCVDTEMTLTKTCCLHHAQAPSYLRGGWEARVKEYQCFWSASSKTLPSKTGQRTEKSAMWQI